MFAKPYIPSTKPVAQKPYLLYFFLIPLVLALLLSLIEVNLRAFLLNGVLLSLYLGTLWLSKQGFEERLAYENSSFAKAPHLPYLRFASLLLGVSVWFASYVASSHTLLSSLFLGVVASVGYGLYYGSDPKEDKIEGLEHISDSFVVEVLTQAYEKLQRMQKRLDVLEMTPLKEEMTQALEGARRVVKRLEREPEKIRQARTFLMVYLEGMDEVIDSYTQLHQEGLSVQTQEELLLLFEALEQKFQEEFQRLHTKSHFDLEVRMETLKTEINEG